MSAKLFDHNNISLLPATSDEPTWDRSYLDITLEDLDTWSRSHMNADDPSVLNSTAEEYLDYLNTCFADRLLPAVVVLAVLMAVGVVGNILVLFMYTCKSKRGTVTLFIQALAVFDLLSCCVAIPGEIIDMTNNYTFGRYPLCKIIRTVNLFCTVSSGATLVVVAIDRYKRICCPLRRQITPKGATIVICICAILALVISLPTVTLYGSRTIPTDLASVNGTDCSISDQFVTTMFPIAYNSLQMFLFLVGAVTLIILYSLIGSKVCHQVNRQQVRRKSVHLGRSRLSPGGASMCSVYSANVNTASRVESDLSSFVNGREATELVKRFPPTNTMMDVTINVKQHSCVTVKGKCLQFNNNSRHNFTAATNFIGEENSLSVHETECRKIECQKIGDRLTEESLGTRTATCSIPHNNEIIDKCNSISGSRSELNNDLFQMKNLIEEEYIGKFKREAKLSVEKQIVEQIEPQNVPEILRIITTPNDDVSVVGSKFNSHFKYCNAEVSTDMLLSAAEVAYLQCDAYSQSALGRSEQSATSLPVQNGELNNGILLTADSTNAHGKVSVMSSPGTPAELSHNPTNELVKTSNGDPKCYSVSDLRAEHTDKGRLHDDSGNDNSRTKISCFKSDNSNSDEQMQTNNNFSVKTSKSKEIKPNKCGKECKNQNKEIVISNNLALKPKTKKKRKNSLKLKPNYTPLVDISNAPVMRKMSMLASRCDDNLDRLEKAKFKESEHNNGSRRTTLMLFLITIIYVLSFLPHLVLMALKALNEETLAGLGSTWELAQNLLIRSYFINSMANPIIYSFFSRNFYRQCRSSRHGCPSS